MREMEESDNLSKFYPQNLESSPKEKENNLIILENITAKDFSSEILKESFFTVCTCRRGKATLTYSDKQFVLEPYNMMFVFGDQQIKDCHASEDFEGRISALSKNLYKESLVGLLRLWPFLLCLFDNPILYLSAEENQRAYDHFISMQKRIACKDHLFRDEAIVMAIRVYIIDLCDILGHHYPQASEKSFQGFNIFDKFFTLAQRHFKKERSVQWYSEQLNITSKYLSEVVKQVSGKTAGQWLSSLVVSEIKRLLKGSTMPVKEIAHYLHFPNQSFLGKYFKHYVGSSPSEYRATVFGKSKQKNRK